MFTIDFETSSRANLQSQGVHVYARHTSTKILCMSYGDMQSNVSLWTPGCDFPSILADHIENGGLIEAHNVAFERSVWEGICIKQLGWPPIDPSQWRCTMAAASRLALPRALGDVCRALGLAEQKDLEGAKALMKLCKPNTKGEMNEDPELLKILYKYCIQDTKAEIGLGIAVGETPEDELAIWQLDQEINNRGLLIDKESLHHALIVIEKCRLQSVENLFNLADGEVTSVTQRNRVLKWIGERLPNGAPAKLDKAAVENLLKTDIPDEVRAMLELRQEGAKSSLGKLKAMKDRMNEDSRVRANQIYYGASTGRWAGAGMQIHNFPRGSLKPADVDFIMDHLLPTQDPATIQAFYGDVPSAISSCLRGFIRAEEGKSLYCCDFSGIEARVLAWVANESELVQAFFGGVDVYKLMASKIFEIEIDDVDKDQRFLGKAAILGAGYGAGYRAFAKSCLDIGKVVIPSLVAKKTIRMYREANPKIIQLWRDTNREAIKCIQTGEPRVINEYLSVDIHKGMFRILLPSGRHLHYHSPKVVKVPAPWSALLYGKIWMPEVKREALESAGVEVDSYVEDHFEGAKITSKMAKYLASKGVKLDISRPKPEVVDQIEFWGVDSQTKRWCQKRAWGSLLVENIVQAISRDLLAAAMIRVENAGFAVVATIHDEILAEVADYLQRTLEEFESLMKEPPSWAMGCPIDVEGYVSKRFKK